MSKSTRLAVILIVLTGITTLYSSDFNYYLDKNPGKMVVLYNPDKQEVNVLVRLNDGTNSYGRLRLTRDSTSFYRDRFKLIDSKLKPSYFRTYGEDQWVQLRRKRTKVSLTVNETDDGSILIRRTTPYYAYYRSGDGGTLIEEFIVRNKSTKLRFVWIPSNKRMKYNHSLKWIVNSNKQGQMSRSGAASALIGQKLAVDWSDSLGNLTTFKVTEDSAIMEYQGIGVLDIDPFISFDIYSVDGSTNFGETREMTMYRWLQATSTFHNMSSFIRVPKNASTITSVYIIMDDSGFGKYSGTSWDWRQTVKLPYGMTFNGTDFFILDVDSDKNLVYDFDKTGSYTGFYFNLSTQTTDPRGLVWNGTFFYVVDGAKQVHEYNSTGDFTGNSWMLTTIDTPNKMSWNGTHFIIGDTYGNDPVIRLFDQDFTEVWNFSVASEVSWAIGGLSFLDIDDQFIVIDDAISGDRVAYRYYSNGTYTGYSFIAGSGSGSIIRGSVWNGSSLWIIRYTDQVREYTDYPHNVSISQQSGATLWSMSGELNQSYATGDLSSYYNSRLNTCAFEDSNGNYCLLRIHLNSDNPSRINLSVNYSWIEPVMDIYSPANLTYFSTPSPLLEYSWQSPKFWNSTLFLNNERYLLESDYSRSFYNSSGDNQSQSVTLDLDTYNDSIFIKFDVPVNYSITSAHLNLTGSCYLGTCEWQVDNAAKSGLTDIGDDSAPSVFQRDGTWYLISGKGDGGWYAWNWTGSTWQVDNAAKSGLTDIGDDSAPSVFQRDGTWYLISGKGDGGWYAWNWTGSAWQEDYAVRSGLGNIGANSTPSVFQRDGTWYLISGEWDGGWYAWNWTGSTWQVDNAAKSGLTDIGYDSAPSVFQRDGTWYLISGKVDGGWYAWNWTGSTWQEDYAVRSGLGNIGGYSAPSVFQRDGTWYLISGKVDGGWYAWNWTDVPHNLTLKLNGIQVWNMSDALNSTTSPVTVSNLTDVLESAPNELVNLNFSSDSTGRVQVDNLYINLTLNSTNKFGQNSIMVDFYPRELAKSVNLTSTPIVFTLMKKNFVYSISVPSTTTAGWTQVMVPKNLTLNSLIDLNSSCLESANYWDAYNQTTWYYNRSASTANQSVTAVKGTGVELYVNSTPCSFNLTTDNLVHGYGTATETSPTEIKANWTTNLDIYTGWNLVAVPARVTLYNISTWFSNVTFVSNGTVAYINQSSFVSDLYRDVYIDPGRAVWVYSNTNETVTMTVIHSGLYSNGSWSITEQVIEDGSTGTQRFREVY